MVRYATLQLHGAIHMSHRSLTLNSHLSCVKLVSKKVYCWISA